MRMLLYTFMALAAIGFALSIGVHCLGIAGIPTPGGKNVWLLHKGTFVVWIPALLAAIQAGRKTGNKNFLAGCPAWMRRTLCVLIGYAIINFIVFSATSSKDAGKPDKEDVSPATIRGVSGHWMVFYGLAFAMIYSSMRTLRNFRERHCPQGHFVSPTDRFCPDCGYPIFEEPSDP